MVLPKVATENDVLARVVVRVLGEEELGQFNYRLEEEHYLESSRLAGQCLRYVAEVDGQWVALLTFSAAALHLKGRERWLGWSPRQRARRLGFVVNNSRFLVLPERQRYPNLASRVLGLALRRLSADWQEHWGHPVLVVESFVDETRYRGTCYRACGFAAVGPTKGFERASRDFYQEHGQPKQLYLRELRPGDRQRLRQARLPAELARHEAEVAGPCPFRAPALESLLDRVGALPDSRSGHGLRHRQRFVLACAAVCTLLGASGYRAFENTSRKFTQRQLRALGGQPDAEDGRYYPPSDSTFQRVLNRIDAEAVASLIGRWLAEQEVGALAQLAVDGKVLRGSGRHDGKPLQLLSAVTHHLRLTLDQVALEEKSNEIPAFKPLLKKLDCPPGTLVTADAMHCQQKSARYLTQELGWDYLFGLKGNQSGILEKAQRLLAQQGFPPQGNWEKGHGRLERRRLARVAVTPEEIGLCGCWQVIAVERYSQNQNKPKESASLEIGCYASSLTVEERDDAQILALIRGHWSAIENGTHYRRDFTLGEDACRTAARPGAAVLASLRNLANGLYELRKEQKRTKVDSLKSWCQQQTFASVWPLLNE